MEILVKMRNLGWKQAGFGFGKRCVHPKPYPRSSEILDRAESPILGHFSKPGVTTRPNPVPINLYIWSIPLCKRQHLLLIKVTSNGRYYDWSRENNSLQWLIYQELYNRLWGGKKQRKSSACNSVSSNMWMTLKNEGVFDK